ncbi:MAG TPA: ABC transporter ATP-binding protein [Methylomirabilota bacterium]|jgi:branched-chain amino acid transport system ATP-binding protein|nr:ABC transporter ATP-binding protein [Methylomirabilota bacterium]
MLEVAEVHTYYGDSHILNGVSVEVRPGEAVAVLGRNGAGKTTLIRTIVGFTPPRDGRVRYDGRELQRLPPYRIARAGIALVPQGRRVFAPLTVDENLRLGARRGPWTVARVHEIFPRLLERRRQPGGTLSGGEQQMLAIGRALLTNPRVVLLDEPSEGLAPLIVREIGRVLRHLKESGLSILLVEQNVPLALRVADRVYVMSKGQIVYHGTASALDADEDVKRRFLGIA